MQPGWAQTSGLGVLSLLLVRWVGSVAPVRPTHRVLVLSGPSVALRVHLCAVSLATCSLACSLSALFRLCSVLGHLAPVHPCARSVRCFACTVSCATWLLFTGVPA